MGDAEGGLGWMISAIYSVTPVLEVANGEFFFSVTLLNGRPEGCGAASRSSLRRRAFSLTHRPARIYILIVIDRVTGLVFHWTNPRIPLLLGLGFCHT
jgi:hypothetical protein